MLDTEFLWIRLLRRFVDDKEFVSPIIKTAESYAPTSVVFLAT